MGAAIVRPDKTIASLGFNGFPRGISDSPLDYSNRDTKYAKTVHGEMNAILSAREAVSGYHIFCTHYPCADCAKAIIQSGIASVTCYASAEDMASRWGSSYGQAEAMLKDAGIFVSTWRVEYDWAPV